MCDRVTVDKRKQNKFCVCVHAVGRIPYGTEMQMIHVVYIPIARLQWFVANIKYAPMSDICNEELPRMAEDGYG